MFVKTLTKLGSPTRGLTPTLSVSGSLLLIVGVSTHDIYNGLNTNAPRLSCARCLYDSPVLSLRVKPTPPLGERCDKTGRVGGGREAENTAEPKPSCHSLTGVLTIMGCHHFLIRPVSKKCCNKTAVQRETPPHHHHHHHTHLHILYAHTHTIYTETRKHIKHVKKCYVQKLGIKL